jgi:hypothetical protein
MKRSSDQSRRLAHEPSESELQHFQSEKFIIYLGLTSKQILNTQLYIEHDILKREKLFN